MMTMEEAQKRYPGEDLYRCEVCGHTAAYGSRKPPPGAIVKHPGCGGIVVLVKVNAS
jgi:rubrerythrin